jgi:acetylornithine/N-succinyldiaminopimelate aminotransferase
MDLNKLIQQEENNFFHTYKRLRIKIEKGEGCYLFTDKGDKILDMFAGLAVNVLGYNHPKVNKAIEEQIRKYIHISNLFYQENQVVLAGKITSLSGYKKVFFTNSGTEAVEAAIKLIRKFFSGTNKKELISFSGSFHGRTMGALSLTARAKYREGYEPLLPNVKHLTYNSALELEQNINENTSAVFIECIQGEGGIYMVNSEFADALNSLHQKYEFILAADEIQSGVGRTGRLHSFEHFGLKPDLIILAKGIGGGLPLGALVGNERVAEVFKYGDHGSTFGGNPVAAAAGLAVFSEIENGLMDNVNSAGDYLFKKIFELKNRYHEKIKEIRGKGLMIGIEMNEQCAPLVEKFMENDVLVNCTNGNVIRLLPPLIMGKEEADKFIEVFEKVLG